MTMTPEQLLELADKMEARLDPTADPEQLRAHAAALEELDAIEADYEACRTRAERAEAALAECRSKLEVDPRTKYDGIDCRDETIRILDERLAEAERKCERLRFHAKKMNDWIQSHYTGPEPLCSINYRAEFKE